MKDRTKRWLRRAAAFGAPAIAAALTMAPTDAEAFSVKVHIHLANEIRAELVRNMEGDCDKAQPWCGKPAVRLLGPENKGTQFVLISEDDAVAIRENPEFWRGGAIGPDNTVFPGMTDPSHAWHFAPFSQCQALVDDAKTGEERAYALGCYLHGITDNNAHHLVNFFTGETFTLYPVEAAKDGALEFSLLNVVRHMTVEGKFEKSLEASRPEALAPEMMKHRIPKDLVRRVYLDPNDEGRGLWHWFAGQLVAKKNEALQAAQLDGFDPQMHLELSIEEIKANNMAIELDGRVMDAYVEFLKNGGEIAGVRPGGLAPADYVILLPEIIEDARRLMEIADAHGVRSMEDLIAEWQADGECSITCPILRGKVELMEHTFGDRDGGPSRFREAVDIKNRQLDDVVLGYLGSVENLSNLIVTEGVGGLGPKQLDEAFAPLTDAIDQVADFPYEVLFPSFAVDVIQSIAPLRAFLEGTFNVVTQRIKEEIVARARTYLEQLREQLLAMQPAALMHIQEQANSVLGLLKEGLDQAKLKKLGLDLSDGEQFFDSFDRSVLYMNAYNSIAGALANNEVVFSTAPTSFFGGGPISFDASYQLEYTQLALCDGLKQAFYPCGTSAAELLQPNFESCEPLGDVPTDAQPNVECHDGKAAQFVGDDVSIESCSRRTIDEIIAPSEGHLGSYTLAHPPELADADDVACVNPAVPGLEEGDGKFDETDQGDDEDAAGCGCRADAPAGDAAWSVLGLIGLAGLRRRRR